jgi:hypothetical protein
MLLLLMFLVNSAATVGFGNDGEASGGNAAANRYWVPDGKWVRDQEGRVLLLRGANYSGLEWGYFSTEPHGPEEADFVQMASWGVSVVRLPIAWTYLEPEPNRIDLGYLRNEVDRVIGFAERHGMTVILDMHQFLWSSCFPKGLGVPPWTCEGKYANSIMAASLAQSDFWRGTNAPDGRPIIEHLVDVWRAVATYYRDSPTVVAFDFLNEPADSRNLFSVPKWEHDTLFPFYRRMASLVRSLGCRQTLVIEPNVIRAIGARAHPEPIGDANTIYSPHIYLGSDSPAGFHGGQAELSAQFAQAAAEAAEMQAPLLVGEWGGDANFVRYALTAEDEQLVGGTIWGYFPSGNELVDGDGNEDPGRVNFLARPYPMQTAGIPKALQWDFDARVLDYTWTEDPAREIPNPTVIFVPVERHFGKGMQITVSEGDTFELQGDRLVITACRSRESHSVRITPRS